MREYVRANADDGLPQDQVHQSWTWADQMVDEAAQGLHPGASWQELPCCPRRPRAGAQL